MGKSGSRLVALGAAIVLSMLAVVAVSEPGPAAAAAPQSVFAHGDAGAFGSTGSAPLSQPIVGMAATPDGGGYWLVARDGGIFTYGNARFFGSAGNINLAQPVVGMAATPDGGGYWLVARDGGIFTYGDAHFAGSAGNINLAQPIVGMAATPDGGGYWLVARDGGVFTYGDAGWFGSEAGTGNAEPFVGMVASHSGKGYWLASYGLLAGPSAIAPLASSPFAGEGQWSAAGNSVGGSAVLYQTYMRPYGGGPTVGVAWMNTPVLQTAVYAGYDQPSGNYSYTTTVAPGLRNRLISAFNGGFRLDASNGGWYEDGQTPIGLRNGAASLIVYSDGTATVGMWGRDAAMGPSISEVRQNLDLLIDGGQINPSSGNVFAWGATLGNVTNTWRSGVGVDPGGHLIYAAGPGLVPNDLARVLQAAGAVRAMELDINPMWPLFDNFANGQPTKMFDAMYYPAGQYFTSNERDFVAVFSPA